MFFLQKYLWSVPPLRGDGGWQGARPLTAACASHFGLLKVLFFKYHSATKQRAMMEKGIVTFNHNFRLTFSQFFESTGNQLLYKNVAQ